jgi:hypothetical protein
MTDQKNSNNTTYVFSHSTFLQALEEWEAEQVKEFPKQKERIQITVVAMQHFLQSEQVKNHKMILSGGLEDHEIKMPVSLKKA